MDAAPMPEDLDARLDRLQREINEARRRLATLRHEGERHFIDDQPVDPAVTEALTGLVNHENELAQLRRLQASHGTALNGPIDSPLVTELTGLETRIADLRRRASTDPHKGERHFIDG